MRPTKAATLYTLTLFWAATAATGAAPVSLADMARSDDLASVVALLEQGADVNGALGDGMTGLHWSAVSGNAEMAQTLILAGAELEATTRIGDHTPLHVATKAGRADVVEALVAAGANVNARTTTGATPLHFAAASGHAESVLLLLEHGADPNPKEPQWGQTPLMFAAAAGRTEAIEVLLEHGADVAVTARVVDVTARNKEDQKERRSRNTRIAQMRATERDPTGAEIESEREETPEERAAKENEAEKKAIEREEAESRGGEPVPLNYAGLVGTQGGLTPLLLAAREGHDDATLALIKGGADINQQSAADKTSPMLIAMINGHFDLAMRLFDTGADPNLTSEAGATPLYAALNMHWAPKSRHPQPAAYMQQEMTYMDVMERLLEAGVDPNARLEKTLWFTTYNRDLLGVGRAGATAFWRAAYALDIPAMKLLLEYGADPNLPTTKVPERRRRREGDDVDHSGLPPIPYGGPGVPVLLAASGVGYGQGFAGNSHRHVPNGWLPAVKFLVEDLGVDVHARDHNGYNAIHHAAARGDNELIMYFVEKGVDVKAIARSGQTTVDMANGPVQRIQPFPETVALLESLGAVNNHNCVSC